MEPHASTTQLQSAAGQDERDVASILATLDPGVKYHPNELTDQATALVAKMTLKEAASLLSGRNFWQLKAIPRLGLESISVSDGPHGLRKQENEADHLGMGASLPATCFPTAVTLAATWDVALLKEVGRRLGAEAAAYGVSVRLQRQPALSAVVHRPLLPGAGAARARRQHQALTAVRAQL